MKHLLLSLTTSLRYDTHTLSLSFSLVFSVSLSPCLSPTPCRCLCLCLSVCLSMSVSLSTDGVCRVIGSLFVLCSTNGVFLKVQVQSLFDMNVLSTFLCVFLERASVSSITAAPSTGIYPGRPVTITCTATGFPAPNLTWTRDQTSLAHLQLTYSVSEPATGVSVLVIPAVNVSDRGNYQCTARNPANTDTRSIKIDVPCKYSAHTTR